MLMTIAILLILLYALGLITSYTMGGLIHLLLVIAVIVILVRLIQGRRMMQGKPSTELGGAKLSQRNLYAASATGLRKGSEMREIDYGACQKDSTPIAACGIFCQSESDVMNFLQDRHIFQFMKMIYDRNGDFFTIFQRLKRSPFYFITNCKLIIRTR